MNPVSMEAAGGFLSVGTQMKIERPGKACAVTPCTDIEGPMVVLEDGEFRRVHTLDEWRLIRERVVSVWDNGEILMGFGEFLENNKNLVPSAYNRDWWAADLLVQRPRDRFRLDGRPQRASCAANCELTIADYVANQANQLFLKVHSHSAPSNTRLCSRIQNGYNHVY